MFLWIKIVWLTKQCSLNSRFDLMIYQVSEISIISAFACLFFWTSFGLLANDFVNSWMKQRAVKKISSRKKRYHKKTTQSHQLKWIFGSCHSIGNMRNSVLFCHLQRKNGEKSGEALEYSIESLMREPFVQPHSQTISCRIATSSFILPAHTHSHSIALSNCMEFAYIFRIAYWQSASSQFKWKLQANAEISPFGYTDIDTWGHSTHSIHRPLCQI